jgi:periplasmic divalent cation tolerance protein
MRCEFLEQCGSDTLDPTPCDMKQVTDTAADLVTLMTTCPDAETAKQISLALVSERLAACVQRIPGVNSTYVWQDKLQEEQEVLLLIKTLKGCVPALAERVRALHPYQVPELLVIPVHSGNDAYAEWVRNSVNQPSSS